MSKLICLALMLVLSLSILADDDVMNPMSYLDRPVTDTSFSLLKFRSTGNFFNNLTIANVINRLLGMNVRQAGSSTWEKYWTKGDVASLKSELTAYYNNFPSSSEVFSATLANGETAYVDSYGSKLSNDQSSSYDQYFGANQSSTLTFYAGRNSSAGTSNYHYEHYSDYNANFKTSDSTSELVITTSNGNEYKIYGYDTSTPLVLDMDGDGKLVASNGQWLPHNFTGKGQVPLVAFDINGDGFVEVVEWVGPNDGLLLVYKPGEPVTGNNLFGFAEGTTDGFEKLSLLDTNNDQKITGDELATLSVWQDKNANAKVDDGEVKSVAELGITEINAAHTNLRSSFRQNGINKVMWDWHPVMFMVKKLQK